MYIIYMICKCKYFKAAGYTFWLNFVLIWLKGGEAKPWHLNIEGSFVPQRIVFLDCAGVVVCDLCNFPSIKHCVFFFPVMDGSVACMHALVFVQLLKTHSIISINASTGQNTVACQILLLLKSALCRSQPAAIKCWNVSWSIYEKNSDGFHFLHDDITDAH